MAIKYRELMKECKITLDSDVLDPAFVSMAKDFEQKLAEKKLTDEEIEQMDNELVELFSKNVVEEDSDEVVKAKHDVAVANAEKEIEKAKTSEVLNKLHEKFKEELPEVLPLIEQKLRDFKADEEKQATEKLIKLATKEIQECPLDQLQALGEKYKKYPELVKLVNEKYNREKPKKENDELAAKLRSKKEWSYKQLEEIGIKPTGNDMTVVGVRLEKEMYFNVYSVRK